MDNWKADLAAIMDKAAVKTKEAAIGAYVPNDTSFLAVEAFAKAVAEGLRDSEKLSEEKT